VFDHVEAAVYEAAQTALQEYNCAVEAYNKDLAVVE